MHVIIAYYHVMFHYFRIGLDNAAQITYEDVSNYFTCGEVSLYRSNTHQSCLVAVSINN